MNDQIVANLILYRKKPDGTYVRWDIGIDTNRNVVAEKESPDDRLDGLGQPLFRGKPDEAPAPQNNTPKPAQPVEEAAPVGYDIEVPPELEDVQDEAPAPEMKTANVGGMSVTQEDLAFSAFYAKSVPCFFSQCEELRKQYKQHEDKLKQTFEEQDRPCKPCDLRDLRQRFNKVLKKAFRRELNRNPDWYSTLPFQLNTSAQGQQKES